MLSGAGVTRSAGVARGVLMQRKHWVLAFAAAVSMALAGPVSAQSSATDTSLDADAYRARYGSVEIEISCNASASAHFEHGLLLMHSFAWSDARDAFREAAAADPGCAMAYWGEAVGYYDGLHGHPSAEEVAEARAALEKANAANAPTQRERDYIAAAEAIYRGYPQVQRQVRDRAFSEAMGRLHAAYPDEDEAAALYAVSLLSLARRGVDNGYELQLQAIGILEPLFEALPEHPGVAHYTIHAYDDSGLRDRGLAAARRYAGIAPALTHALHMPSHIFSGLGMWNDAIASDESVLDVAPLNAHSSMYLSYAYMQKGQREKAEALVEALRTRALSPQGTEANARGLHSANTWFLLEGHDWKTAAQAPAYSDRLLDRAETLYVRGLGAARGGDLQAAGGHLEALNGVIGDLRSGNDSGVAVRILMSQIQAKQIEAWIRLAEGKGEAAVSLMHEAVQMEDAPGVSWAPPDSGTGLPAREIFGEILLELGRYDEARQQFQAALERTPNRLRSILGLARAAVAANDPDAAHAGYQTLLRLLADADEGLAETAEAQAYLEGGPTARVLQ